MPDSHATAEARGRAVRAVARWRVPIGFAAGALVLLAASPSWASWRAGFIVAVIGEAIRVWAAGHLEKSREVTRSGPYRWTRHPLYAGSAVIGAGVVIASDSLLVAAAVAVYLAVTLAAAIRTEEAFLRQAFGDTYDRYRRSQSTPMRRAFSLERARRNKEYRGAIGVVLGFALLALKVALPL
jgi:protein-S-isoprenylcysteine O-methyltransferase Ste14